MVVPAVSTTAASLSALGSAPTKSKIGRGVEGGAVRSVDPAGKRGVGGADVVSIGDSGGSGVRGADSVSICSV